MKAADVINSLTAPSMELGQAGGALRPWHVSTNTVGCAMCGEDSLEVLEIHQVHSKSDLQVLCGNCQEIIDSPDRVCLHSEELPTSQFKRKLYVNTAAIPRTKLALKSSVTRRQDESVDQLERLAQAGYHQAAEAAAITEAATVTAEPVKDRDTEKPKREANGLQTAFLAGNLGKPVSVFLINGIRVIGKICQFDQFTILLQAPGGMDQMIFKHAVASIQPSSHWPKF